MKRILKYQLAIGPQTLNIGRILHVAFQQRVTEFATAGVPAMSTPIPHLWALTDPAEAESVTLYVALTGDSPPADAEHVGSMVSPDGSVVLHVFRQVS